RGWARAMRTAPIPPAALPAWAMFSPRFTKRSASTGKRNITRRSAGPSKSRILWTTPPRHRFRNSCERNRALAGALLARSRMATYRVSVDLLFAEPCRQAGGLHIISSAAKGVRLQLHRGGAHRRAVSLGLRVVLAGGGNSG